MNWTFIFFYTDSFGLKHRMEKTFLGSDLVTATCNFCNFCKKYNLNLISFYID